MPQGRLAVRYGRFGVGGPQSRVASPRQWCRAARGAARSCGRSLRLRQAAGGGPGEPLRRRYHAAASGCRPGHGPGALRLLPGSSSKPAGTRVRPLRPVWGLLGSRRERYRSLVATLPGRPRCGPGPASSGPPIPPCLAARLFSATQPAWRRRSSATSPCRSRHVSPSVVRCPLAGAPRRAGRPPVTVASAWRALGVSSFHCAGEVGERAGARTRRPERRQHTRCRKVRTRRRFFRALAATRFHTSGLEGGGSNSLSAVPYAAAGRLARIAGKDEETQTRRPTTRQRMIGLTDPMPH